MSQFRQHDRQQDSRDGPDIYSPEPTINETQRFKRIESDKLSIEKFGEGEIQPAHSTPILLALLVCCCWYITALPAVVSTAFSPYQTCKKHAKSLPSHVAITFFPVTINCSFGNRPQRHAILRSTIYLFFAFGYF